MNSLLNELESQNYLFELRHPIPSNLDHSKMNLNFICENQFSVNVNENTSLNQIIKFLSDNNIEVINMTNETNRLVESYQVEVDSFLNQLSRVQIL